ANRVAILRPRAVIVANFVTEDAGEHEPGVARTLANTAIGDDRLGAVDADGGESCLEFVSRLERAVFIDRAAPWEVHGARDVTGANGKFLHAFGCKDFARIFLRTADIDERDVCA